MTFGIDNPEGGCNNPPLGKYVWEKPSGEQGLIFHNQAIRFRLVSLSMSRIKKTDVKSGSIYLQITSQDTWKYISLEKTTNINKAVARKVISSNRLQTTSKFMYFKAFILINISCNRWLLSYSMHMHFFLEDCLNYWPAMQPSYNKWTLT